MLLKEGLPYRLGSPHGGILAAGTPLRTGKWSVVGKYVLQGD